MNLSAIKNINLKLLKSRIIRSLKLEQRVFAEVEADKLALEQAILVVILSSLAAGIGMIAIVGIISIITTTILTLIAWVLWIALTYLIATKIIRGLVTKVDLRQFLRTVGFSSSAGLIRILGIIPHISAFVFFIASVWMLTAMVLAVKQVFNYQRLAKAIVVCLAAWLAHIGLIAMALFLFVK